MLQEKRTAAAEFGRLGRAVAEAGAWGIRCCGPNEWRDGFARLGARDVVVETTLL